MAQVYGAVSANLASDFSTTNNPNGGWRYVNDTTTISSSTSGLGFTGWALGPSSFFGSPLDNGGVFLINDATQYPWSDGQNGDVVVHAPSLDSSTFVGAGVAWTSPVDGIFSISGRAWDALHESGRDSSWKLYLDGMLMAQKSSIFGVMRGDSAADIANSIGGFQLNNLAVLAGNEILFLTESTTFDGHFTGVELNIVQVPELQSYALLLSLCPFLIFWRRRFSGDCPR